MRDRDARLALRLRGCLLTLLAVAAVMFGGCAGPDDEVSSRDRPWNEPQGWETGMPPGFYEGRR